jgi:hypothetical protein
MFFGPDAPGGGDTLTDEQFREQAGYPRNTKVDDMTDAEQAKYWRSKSKGFQKESETKDREIARWTGLGEFDAVSTTIATAETERQKTLTDAQRAQEAAQQAEAAARAAGTAEARSKFLAPAVESQIVLLTKGADETPDVAKARVKAALQFVDVNRFLGADGNLDDSLIQTFAQSIAPVDETDNDKGGDPLANLMGRQKAPAPGSGGSIADIRKATAERLGKK